MVGVGAALMLPSWCGSAISMTAAPRIAVVDNETPGARNTYMTFVAALERRFAAARVKPEVRFVPLGVNVDEQNRRALGEALRAIGPDIIIASNLGHAQMAGALNMGKPIIFYSPIDPVAGGLTDSLTRPNKGMTGFTLGTRIALKRREMLLRLAPRCRLMGLLSSTLQLGEGQMQPAAESLAVFPGIEQRNFTCDDLGQLAALVKSASARMVDAWDVEYTLVPYRYAEETVRQFNTLRRPVIYPRMKHVYLGGMAAYAPNIDEADEVWVSQVSALLAGVPIEEIPVVQATRYSFGLNLKACHRVGVEPPKSLIRIADVVLE